MDSIIAMPKIPVISFSKQNMKPGTSSWLKTRKDVCVALEECGCFEAICEEFSLDVHNTMFGAMKELYDLPIETKKKNINDKPFRGYVSANPLHESLGIDDPTNLEEAQKFTNLMWPHHGHDRIRESSHSMAKIMKELDQTVTKMVFEDYGVDKYYESHIKSTGYALRFAKYKEADNDENKESIWFGLPSHTDRTFTTIIHQDQVDGLEVQTKEGQWVLYHPSSHSSFIFLAADGFKVWSNGRIRSCYHRVIMKEKERYSLGLFTFNEGVIHVPEELIDDDHPLRFKPLDHFDYLRKLMIAKANKVDYTVEAHCGV